ncbi:class I SAM-dependent methyltransferase [Catenulispora subtropica]|uniref:Class I SAM-dependent methyltransferase n=1 Tax=Catenulispora subtropica TaxID=450798 RepID=A0ABN2SLV1_9ACTN
MKDEYGDAEAGADAIGLAAIRASYDTVAADYAELAATAFDALSEDHKVLADFADRVRGDGLGPIADLGCGPGHVTAFLAGRGGPVFGVDLSPGMIAVAESKYPDLRFHVGSMTRLALADASLGGVLTWYSTHHMPAGLVAEAFTEVCRVLAPGGRLLWGSHAGTGERVAKTEAYGHPVSYESHLLPVDQVAGLIEAAGLRITARQEEQVPGSQRWHARLWAVKAGVVGAAD